MDRTFDLTFQEPITVGDLLLQLGFDQSEARTIQVFSNGNRVGARSKLHNRDKIFITIPVGGG